MDIGENKSKGTLAMDSDWDNHVAEEGAGAESASAFQLKVLSGRHTGAVMPLSPGRYSLGQDEESDFIFLDDAFLGGRMIVDVTGAEPAIEATGLLKATLEGRELVTGQPTPLPHYLPVEVGATRFAIGPSHLPWPEPAAPQPEPPEAAAADAGNPEASGSEEGGQPPADAGGQPDGIQAKAKAPKKTHKLLRLLMFAAVAILAVIGGFASWWLYPRSTVDHAAALRTLVADLGLSEARVEDGAGGLLIKGFIRTDAERDSLLSRLGQAHAPARVELVSAEEIRSSIKGVLDLIHVDCSITIAPGGKTAVDCILEKPGMSRELTESLRQAAPPAAVLDIRLHPASEVFSFLNGQLSALVLDHKIHPELLEGRIGCVLVRGKMDSLELATWNGIREAFLSKFGMALEERWTERLSPVLQRFQNLARALDSQLVGVTVGEMSYITLKRRRKYFEGARLGGLTLKSIRKDRLVLSLDNVEQNYFLKKESK